MAAQEHFTGSQDQLRGRKVGLQECTLFHGCATPSPTLKGARITMAIPDLSRFEQFLAVPVEDIQGRTKLNLTEEDVGELHALAVNGQVPWDFYHQVNNAMKADVLYCHQGKDQGWTVAYIRKQMGRTMYRHYSEGGEDIREWISGRLWPKGLHIERIRSRKEPLRVIHEVELAFSPETDLEGLWERQRPEFEEEGIELLQKFPENQFVQDMCFLPEDPNFEVRFVISAGKRRKELRFPIALRYEPFLKKVEKNYTLDITKSPPDHNQPLQRASTEEMQEAISGFWSGVLTYNPSKGPIAPHMKKKTTEHMGKEYKSRSRVIKDPETGKTRRVLRARLDRAGGSLDDPITGNDGTEARTLGETIAGPHAGPLDKGILIRQILDSLIDETDRQIVNRILDGQSEKQIAKDLGITPPAVTQRLKRLGKSLFARGPSP